MSEQEKDKKKARLRDYLLMTMDEAVQAVYEIENDDYDNLDSDLQDVVDALNEAAQQVRIKL